MLFRLLSTFCCTLFLTACVSSGFEANYQPVLDYGENSFGGIEKCNIPQVEKLMPESFGESLKQVQERTIAKGYVLVGRAYWKSTSHESNEDALEQGKKVGACLVLWRQEDAGIIHTTETVSDYIPAKTITVKSSGTHGHDKTVVTEDARYEYHEVPVSKQQYEYVGLFFAKKRKEYLQAPDTKRQ